MNKKDMESIKEKAKHWDMLNSTFHNPIDWSRIEIMAIKEVGKETQIARMG